MFVLGGAIVVDSFKGTYFGGFKPDSSVVIKANLSSTGI